MGLYKELLFLHNLLHWALDNFRPFFYSLWFNELRTKGVKLNWIWIRYLKFWWFWINKMQKRWKSNLFGWIDEDTRHWILKDSVRIRVSWWWSIWKEIYIAENSYKARCSETRYQKVISDIKWACSLYPRTYIPWPSFTSKSWSHLYASS